MSQRTRSYWVQRKKEETTLTRSEVVIPHNCSFFQNNLTGLLMFDLKTIHGDMWESQKLQFGLGGTIQDGQGETSGTPRNFDARSHVQTGLCWLPGSLVDIGREGRQNIPMVILCWVQIVTSNDSKFLLTLDGLDTSCCDHIQQNIYSHCTIGSKKMPPCNPFSTLFHIWI